MFRCDRAPQSVTVVVLLPLPCHNRQKLTISSVDPGRGKDKCVLRVSWIAVCLPPLARWISRQSAGALVDNSRAKGINQVLIGPFFWMEATPQCRFLSMCCLVRSPTHSVHRYLLDL